LTLGDTVLGIIPFVEPDRTSQLLAVTTEKIYRHDRVNADWDDVTQSGVTMASAVGFPISYVAIAHNDTDIYINDDTTNSLSYFHLVVCDGGKSNIQRWAGKYETDFGDLVGAGGYHDGTTHRALQVGTFKNRLILINPQDYSGADGAWRKNNSRIRWPVISKIQTWTGTGSGFVDLWSTGGENIWSGQLGSQYIVYQDNSIWSLNYVGGTTVFSPEVLIPDLGLLSNNLLVTKNNIHYFVGNDYNVYAYKGGTVYENIGREIHNWLQDELDPQYENRCWMRLGRQNKWLWLFMVPSGSTYITKAYGRSMVTGKWTIRDFSNKWSTGGITATNLIGAETYEVGDSYQDALDAVSIYQADASTNTSADVTIRYGDFLLDNSRTLTKDYTTGDWTDSGTYYFKAAQTFTADITENDRLAVIDGSNSTNVAYGRHYYTVYDISADGYKVKPTCTSFVGDNTGPHGIADASDTVPADISSPNLGFYSNCSGGDNGETYAQTLSTVLVDERMLIGDSGGFIYTIDPTYTTDDSELIVKKHRTPVFDFQRPGEYKRWKGIRVVAKEKTLGNGTMFVRYRLGSFDTTDSGWTDFTLDLTTEWQETTFYMNNSSKAIQFEFADFSGGDFEVREFEILDPLLEGDR
jgi:hypothetical protein